MQVPIRRHPGRAGASIIYIPILMLILLAFAGFAADFGWLRVNTVQLQDSADAAALAGVLGLPSNSDAHDDAIAFAAQNRVGGQLVVLNGNTGNDPAGDVVLGRINNGVFSATLDRPHAVRVVARKTNASQNGAVPLFLGRLFGVSSVNVERQAIASTAFVAIVLLHPTQEGLKISGDGGINVDGSIYVNSSHEKAMSVSGNGTVTAQSFEIVGGVLHSGNGPINGSV